MAIAYMGETPRWMRVALAVATVFGSFVAIWGLVRLAWATDEGSSTFLGFMGATSLQWWVIDCGTLALWCAAVATSKWEPDFLAHWFSAYRWPRSRTWTLVMSTVQVLAGAVANVAFVLDQAVAAAGQRASWFWLAFWTVSVAAWVAVGFAMRPLCDALEVAGVGRQWAMFAIAVLAAVATVLVAWIWRKLKVDAVVRADQQRRSVKAQISAALELLDLTALWELGMPTARVSELAEKAVRSEALAEELRTELERQKQLVADLQGAVMEAERSTKDSVVEEAKACREELQVLCDAYVEYLDQMFFPVATRFEGVVGTSEILHQRMQSLVDSLDGGLARLGVDEQGITISVRVPSDPEETFFGGSESYSEERLKEIWVILIKSLHSDKFEQFGMRWAVDLFGCVTKYVLKQREDLQSAKEACR